MAAGEPGGGAPPFELARALLAALAEGRVEDVLALTDPQVMCMPVTRPARSLYEGHAGMAQMMDDLYAVWGKYRLEVEDADAGTQADPDGGVRVTVRIQIIEAERVEGAGPPVLAEFTVRNGLVTCIEASYEGEE